VNSAAVESNNLWLSPADLTRATGWELKPQGACFGDRCVPISAGRESKFVRPGLFNLSALARHLGEPSVYDKQYGVWSFSDAPDEIGERLRTLQAPDFTLPDLDGKLHSLLDYRGKKVLLMSWASWWGCRFDLPVWQAIYEELKNKNFTIIAVAFDTGGRSAVESWIRPATPIDLPEPLRDIMGWGPDLCAKAVPPTYLCLIDERHIVAQLYNMTNVPMAVWIDEQGYIVRPAEPAGTSDGFRKMDRTTFWMSVELAEKGRATRRNYVDALRDWVNKGNASAYALSPDRARTRIEAPSTEEALANANFRLWQYFLSQGKNAEAQHYFDIAKKLCPESWHFVRQALEMIGVGNASGPEFFAAVDALGDRSYYRPIEFTERSR
jgi:thiol-disulfide isomerase/thioredoxin